MPPQRASLTGRDVSTMQRRRARRALQVRQKILGRAVDPLDIVDDEQHRRAIAERHDQLLEHIEQRVLFARARPPRRLRIAGQPQPGRKRDTGRRTIAFERREHRVDRRVRDVGRTVGVELPMRADEPQDRKQRMILPLRLASAMRERVACARTVSHSPCTRRDLPIPASPTTSRGGTPCITRRCRASVSCHARSSAPSSRVRPIIGARMPPSSESNGVSARRSPSSSCTGCGARPARASRNPVGRKSTCRSSASRASSLIRICPPGQPQQPRRGGRRRSARPLRRMRENLPDVNRGGQFDAPAFAAVRTAGFGRHRQPRAPGHPHHVECRTCARARADRYRLAGRNGTAACRRAARRPARHSRRRYPRTSSATAPRSGRAGRRDRFPHGVAGRLRRSSRNSTAW